MAYTNIDDPSAHFQTVLYTGNGGTLSVTNDGNSDLQPDWVWIKNRAAYQHQVYDTNRGVHKKLMPSVTNAESTDTTALTAFNTDGFSTGANVGVNQNSVAHVAWQWKANGGTTTTFNESGSNPGGTRQTNTDAGFSIIAYTGTGSNGTIAHGLPSTPEFIIFKRRDVDQFWCVWHQGIGDDYKLALHLTDARDADGAFMNSTLPTSSNITVGGASVNTNANNGTYICYAFSPIQGYSKFGSYVGNGNANGPFVYTGFKPAFLLVKAATTAGQNWLVQDNKRPGYNPTSGRLFANTNGAENTDTELPDHLSNGFKVRSASYGTNKSGETYIYMAFAENPFVTSTGVPTTAR